MKNAHLMVVDDEVRHMRALCDTLGFEGYQRHRFRFTRAGPAGPERE